MKLDFTPKHPGSIFCDVLTLVKIYLYFASLYKLCLRHEISRKEGEGQSERGETDRKKGVGQAGGRRTEWKLKDRMEVEGQNGSRRTDGSRRTEWK